MIISTSAPTTGISTACRRNETPALTEEQRRFAARNHDLILSFLNRQGWEEGEYYDIAAFGFLAAVKRYLTQPELRRYAFSTVAWRSMGRSIASFHRAEARRKETELRYLESAPKEDPMVELEVRLFLHDLASSVSPEQYQMAVLRLQGYSIAETAMRQGMTPKRVRKLLRELYRVYFQLYPNRMEART